MPCEKRLTSKFSGHTVIDGFFETWVKKNSVLGEELSKTVTYRCLYKTLDDGLGYFSMDVYACDGEGDTVWGWDESCNLLPNVRHVCTLKADLSGLQRFLTVRKGPGGGDYWAICYTIDIHLGGTALKARMTWSEGVSISYLHPQGADIWVCLSGNPA